MTFANRSMLIENFQGCGSDFHVMPEGSLLLDIKIVNHLGHEIQFMHHADHVAIVDFDFWKAIVRSYDSMRQPSECQECLV
jgi:hypothetical protein